MPNLKLKKAFFIGALLAYLSVLGYGALSTKVGQLIPLGTDKLLHFAQFAVLAFLLFFTLASFGLKKPLVFGLVVLISAVFGVLSELAQKFLTTTRSASGLDFLADMLGVVLALLVMGVFEWISSRQSS